MAVAQTSADKSVGVRHAPASSPTAWTVLDSYAKTKEAVALSARGRGPDAGGAQVLSLPARTPSDDDDSRYRSKDEVAE